LSDLQRGTALHGDRASTEGDGRRGVEHTLPLQEEEPPRAEPMAPGRAGAARRAPDPARAGEVDPRARLRSRLRGSFRALPPDETNLRDDSRRGPRDARMGVAAGTVGSRRGPHARTRRPQVIEWPARSSERFGPGPSPASGEVI